MEDNEEFIRLAEELNETKDENEELRQKISKLQLLNSALERKLSNAATDRSEITT